MAQQVEKIDSFFFFLSVYAAFIFRIPTRARVQQYYYINITL